jgi:hypothetical protein
VAPLLTADLESGAVLDERQFGVALPSRIEGSTST